MIDPSDTRRTAAREIESRTTDALESIPGVLAAAVWMRDPLQIREAYVTGAPGASLAALQRAVADLLRERGLRFTPDSVQVAVLDEATAPPPLWRGRYLILDAIEVHRADQRVTCRVHLIRRATIVTGEAREVDTEFGGARAAALATLDAAARAAGGIQLGLEGIQLQESFGRRYVILSVESAFARHHTRLPGIAPIDRAVEDAACFAALHAIERWLAW